MYKIITTARGFTYNYLSVTPRDNQPTLLFMHGFPDTSHGWYHQIDYFRSKGYGLIVPDMLGYGGTEKPTDPAAFLLTAIAQDVINILDAEGNLKAYAIAHDWGSGVASILSVKHSDRFLGFAFVAVPYSPPAKTPPLDEILKQQTIIYGHPIIGYWTFFTKASAASEMEEHIDSLLDVLYPKDPSIWKTLMNIPDKLEPFVVEGKRLQSADYFPVAVSERFDVPDELITCASKPREQLKSLLVQGGMKSPLNWYNSVVQGVNDGIIDGVKPEELIIKKPVLLALAKFDYVAIESYARAIMEQYTSADLLTINPYDTGHWIHLETPGQFNADLERWIEITTHAA